MKRDYRFNAIDPDKYFVTSKDLDEEADYEAKPLPRLGEPSINNLAISRPAFVACGQCGHRYSYKAPWCPSCGGVATEEAELLRTAQYREVVLRHIPWIRAQALKRWDTLNPRRNMGTSSAIASCGAIDLLPPKQERAIQFNDFVDACVEALWEAITRWRPSNNKLNAFARKFILGALSDIAADWRNKPGLQMDSRIQRFRRSHPYWAPKWIQERFPHYSIQRIEDEQQPRMAANL